jgi:hypothetical protein
MKNSLTFKVGYFVVLFVTVIILPVNVFSVEQQANSWLDEPVTIRFQNEPLSKMLEKISKKTGIAILYDQELANDKVSGNYKDVKVSDAITRLFCGKNKSIQVSKDKKVIVVKTFGAKTFIWAVSDAGEQGNEQNLLDSMSLAELDQLTSQQYLKYKECIANDNELLSEFGKTRGELRAMQDQQYKEYRESIANDEEFLPEFGMIRGELDAMQVQQYKEYKECFTNDNEMLIEFDKTRAELNVMHELQNKEYKNSISRDDEFLPEFGMPYGELRAMQERQYKEFKDKQLSEIRM